jgi:hypothetical protein
MLTGRIIVKGQLFGAVVLNGPVYHGHRLDLTRSPVNEYWSHPPKLSMGFGPLPVLHTFRGKEPFSRRGGYLGADDCPNRHVGTKIFWFRRAVAPTFTRSKTVIGDSGPARISYAPNPLEAQEIGVEILFGQPRRSVLGGRVHELAP